MTVQLYDNISLHENILLDLPFREGIRAITHDIAKPHHVFDLNNTPTWATLASGLGVLDFNGINEYLDSPAADTADLDLTGNYSLAGWVNWEDTTQSLIMMGRYGVDLDGWETFFDVSGGRNTLSLRHHHLSLAPNLSDSCFSVGWTPGTWWLMGITRNGVNPKHYRNGQEVEVTFDASGVMLDPDSSNRDMVVGVRFTKDANFFKNRMWRLRAWDEELSAIEMETMYEIEKQWFP